MTHGKRDYCRQAVHNLIYGKVQMEGDVEPGNKKFFDYLT